MPDGIENLQAPTDSIDTNSLQGFFYALTALLIWGFSPIYWKTLSTVPSLEVVMHRVVWSFLFLLPLVFRGAYRREFLCALADIRILSILFCTTLLISANWLIFIWAIASEFVLQTSLGYYINPLFNVLLGVIFLKERLRRAQIFAVILAGAGVLHLTVSMGQPPWIALSLACTFALYSLIRKIAPVSALTGLTLETMLMSLPAIAWLLYLHLNGSGAFLHRGTRIDLLLMASTLATGFPLLLFTIGARRMRFTTLGFMQYILPSCYFLCAVFIFGEPFSGVQVTAFILIWIALAIYSADTLLLHGKSPQPTS